MRMVEEGTKECREMSILEWTDYQGQKSYQETMFCWGRGGGYPVEGSSITRCSVVALLCRPELMAENAVTDWTP